MGLNRVWLMGTVVLAPRAVADELGGGEVSLIATVRADRSQRVERFRVRSIESDFPPVGSQVLVEGALATVEAQGVVLVRTIAVLQEPAPPTAPTRTAGGTHASPTLHQRQGHWRTLGRGSVRERMVWVRTATVGRSTIPATPPSQHTVSDTMQV